MSVHPLRRTPIRLALALAAGALLAIARSPRADAHDHVLRHVAWPGAHPVAAPLESRPPQEPWRDVTFVVRPIRVDLDETAPGAHGVRAVRLHLRGLERPLEEQTIAFEAPLFASEAAMKAFQRSLAPLMRQPILSMRVRVIEDADAPAWNRRWRATELPIWAETPFRP